MPVAALRVWRFYERHGMAFSKLKALLRKAAERTILGLLRKIGRIAKAFLVAGSFYTATLFELTHVQAITLRIVVGISATGLTASTIVLVQIIPLNSGLAKAFIVAGSLAAGAAGYTGLPAHQKGNFARGAK